MIASCNCIRSKFLGLLAPLVAPVLAFAALSATYGCEKAQIIRPAVPTNIPQESKKPEGSIPVDDGNGTVSPPPTGQVKFASVFDAVFKENCVQCHNGTRAKGGVDVSTADGLLNPKSGKHVVVVNDAEASLLYTAVRDGDMPPRGALSAEQIALIKSFVDSGANP